MEALKFHPLNIDDRESAQNITLKAGRRNCNYNFANLVGWRFWFNTELCVLDDAVVLSYTPEGRKAYMICTAKSDITWLLPALRCHSQGDVTLIGLEDEQVEASFGSAEEARSNGITITPMRNNYDYIYLREELALLKGGKLKAKRNHVNKFLADHPDFEYRPLHPHMFDECRQLEIMWRNDKKHDNPAYGDTIGAEQRVMENIFANWDRLGMMGGCIYAGGRMVAFTFGAAVTDDTIDVCVEKADRNIDGAYSIINQQFASHLPEQYVYINREEDMGLEGLRKAKLSYHPEILLSFNIVKIKA